MARDRNGLRSDVLSFAIGRRISIGEPCTPNDNPVESQDVMSRYLAPGGDNVKLVYVLYLASVLV